MLKSKTGGKSIGRGWKGRACRAVMRVARRVGGSGDSVVVLVQLDLGVERRGVRRGVRLKFYLLPHSVA